MAGTKSKTKYTTQHIENVSFDEVYEMAGRTLWAFDPVNEVLRRVRVDNLGNLMISERRMTVAIEYSGDNAIYIGEAAMGSGKDEAAWRIKKMTYSGDKITDVQWASGNDNYEHIWDNRASLSYS